jgi:hypothetical protein
VIYKGKRYLVVDAVNVGKDLIYSLRLPGMLPSDKLVKAHWSELILVNTDLNDEEPSIVY